MRQRSYSTPMDFYAALLAELSDADLVDYVLCRAIQRCDAIANNYGDLRIGASPDTESRSRMKDPVK